MRKTFVFGHRKPDTDALAASISMAYLKNQLGEACEARSLGDINKETEYALKYFNVPEPKYLNDVKLQIKDIEYHKGFMVKHTDTIFNAYQIMLKEGLTGLPVVKDDETLVGIITVKDLSYTFISETVRRLHSSYDNLLKVLKGEALVRYDNELEADILVAAYRSRTFIEKVKLHPEMALIVGDRHSIIEYAIESKVKLLIISGDCEIKPHYLRLAEENKVNIIRSSYDTFHITKLISLANYIFTMIRIYDPVKFEDISYVSEVMELNPKNRHTNYPIVDKNNKCLGLLKVSDLADKKPKKVILVDHNEMAQSATGIEEAEIVEIIDHHNLGSITTTLPVDFRNMAVGSTNTILYYLYQEKNVTIPKEIAGMMLSGILSDTLVLNSPTATNRDKVAVEALSTIAGVDYEKYGMDLLKAGTSLKGMTKEDVVHNDFKVYTVNNKTFAVGQFFTMNFSDIEKELDEYVKVLDEEYERQNYELVVLYVTDIIKQGSYIIYNSASRPGLEAVYGIDNLDEGHFFEGCVSRKRHVVPLLMELFDN